MDHLLEALMRVRGGLWMARGELGLGAVPLLGRCSHVFAPPLCLPLALRLSLESPPGRLPPALALALPISRLCAVVAVGVSAWVEAAPLMQNEGESTGDEKRNKQKFAKASTQNMHKNAEKCGCGDSHRHVESALSMLRHQSWSNYSCRAPGSHTTHANKLRLLQGREEEKKSRPGIFQNEEVLPEDLFMTAASTNGSSEAFTRGAISRRARFVASSFSNLSDLATCLLSSHGSELEG